MANVSVIGLCKSEPFQTSRRELRSIGDLSWNTLRALNSDYAVGFRSSGAVAQHYTDGPIRKAVQCSHLHGLQPITSNQKCSLPRQFWLGVKGLVTFKKLLKCILLFLLGRLT